MRIFYSPYELKPRASLSSRASAESRHGVLLKVEHPGLGIGYADLFPWTELGDTPLTDQLELLKHRIHTPLTRNAIEFSQIDATARARGVSLWENLKIPESHALVIDP